LGEHTIIEIFRRGHPDAISQNVERLSLILETVVLSSSSLYMSRKQFQKHLAITTHRRHDSTVTIGPNFYALRSRTKPESIAKGIPINQRFVNRFQLMGFPLLIRFCISDNELSQRVCSTLTWLLESRQEPSLGGAIVKTAIALESLLIFNDTEPLSRSLSERCAFMLTQDPSERVVVSKLVRHFYKSRSGVVHGSRRRGDSVSINLLEAIDRLILFLCLLLTLNQNKWSSDESLREWCEMQRWDAPDKTIKIPYTRKYFQNTLKLASSE
jgi:hypothetical protein